MVSGAGPPDSNATLIVSGGGRGIAARCVVRLAERFGCQFVLLGRTRLDRPEPDWAADSNDATQLRGLAVAAMARDGVRPTPEAVERAVTDVLARREVDATLRQLAAAGRKARYVSVDITDRAALSAQLGPVLDQLGPSRGLIHAAGVLADRPMARKTAADFDAVYRPKVDGLANLLHLMPVESLSWLVLFSSAAAFYGNPGQADYALANEVLNKFAHLVRWRNAACHVVALNWGPWDTGMVTPGLKNLFAERGIRTIPVDAGADALAEELATNGHAAQVLAGAPLASQVVPAPVRSSVSRVHRHLRLEANPFLIDHVLDGRPVLPAATAGAWLAETCEALHPGYRLVRWHEFRVYRGLVFDDALPDDLITEVRHLDHTGPELRLEARVWSANPRGQPVYHYGAEFVLSTAAPDPPVEALPSATRDAFAGEGLYRDGTLFHGPRFQGVRRVLRLDPDEIALECLLAPVGEHDQGQFGVMTLNHFAADVAFQALVIWARRHLDAASLPLRCASGESFAPVPFGQTFFVRARIRSANETTLSADLAVQGPDGRLYLRLGGAEVTISRQLNAAFARSAGAR